MAAGGISAISAISASSASGVTLADPAVRRHARDIVPAISGSIRSSSRNYIGWVRDDDRGIGVFARASYSPPDRNLIDYLRRRGAGIYRTRASSAPKDKFGIAAAYAHVSPRVRALDGDFQRACRARVASAEFRIAGDGGLSVRGSCRMDPSAELSVHRESGGGATNPLGGFPGKALNNAEVFGLRTVLKF